MGKLRHGILVLALGAGLTVSCGPPLLVSNANTTYGGPTSVAVFSDLEREAARYGFISVGAIRVAPYDLAALSDLRQKQISVLDQIGKDINSGVPKPELSAANLSVTQAIANLSLYYKSVPDLSKAPGAPALDTALFTNLQSSLNTLFAAALQGVPLEANRIDVARLRMGYLKYLMTEYENLSLLETVPLDDNHFRRVVVSMNLTALLRAEETQGAAVFLDLYPSNVDAWAHGIGRYLSSLQRHYQSLNLSGPLLVESINRDVQREWDRRLVRELQDILYPTPDTGKVVDLRLPRYTFQERGLADPFAEMHVYLARNHLLPKVIHVEPLDEGELVNQLSLTASATRLGLDAGGGTGLLSGIFGGAYGTTSAEGENIQRVNPLSLAFAAGDNRAGWLFLPSRTSRQSPVLKPTERRIKMVLDIPRYLKTVDLNVHKMYTDGSLLPLRSLPFERQLAYLNQARHLLSDADLEDYPSPYTQESRTKLPGDEVTATDFKSLENWSLMKSRMRNLLFQSWSEALHFQIPEEPKAATIPEQTAGVVDNGESESTVVLKSPDPILARTIQSAVLEVDPPEDGSILQHYSFQAQKIDVDRTGKQITFTFPSMKALGVKSLERLRMLVNYKERYFTEGKPERGEFGTIYAVKKKEKPAGFSMVVSSTQILVGKDSSGSLLIRFAKPDDDDLKAATKIKFSVQGADFRVKSISPLSSAPSSSPPDPKLAQLVPPQTNPVPSAETTVPADVMVELTLYNLSEFTPVVVSAQDVSGKSPIDVKPITLRVERPKDADKGQK